MREGDHVAPKDLRPVPATGQEALEDTSGSSGAGQGWQQDLTTAGIEPNPGPRREPGQGGATQDAGNDDAEDRAPMNKEH